MVIMVCMFFPGLPAVITFAVPSHNKMNDGRDVAEVLNQIHDEGAAVVGLNCSRGPATMLPMLRSIKDKVKVSTIDW